METLITHEHRRGKSSETPPLEHKGYHGCDSIPIVVNHQMEASGTGRLIQSASLLPELC
jgi:hypothetical protein